VNAAVGNFTQTDDDSTKFSKGSKLIDEFMEGNV
jgi:hypothetical protein